MNYQKIYDSLIERARNRITKGYTEQHHIVPKCMGGKDLPENLVALYPEEHFTAHVLLVKIYPYSMPLIKAVQAMCGGNENQGRKRRELFGWLRRKHALAMSLMNSGEGNSQYGTMWICNPVSGEKLKIKKGTELPDGWVEGMRPKASFNCQRCDLKVPKARGKYCTECWKIVRFDLSQELGSRSDNPGRIKKGQKRLEGKVYATDGVKTITLKKDADIPEGFVFGRAPYKLRKHER